MLDLEYIFNRAMMKGGKRSPQSLHYYYSDDFPREIYKARHPSLLDEEMKYIEANYRNPVKRLFSKAINTVKKRVFNPDNYAVLSEDTEFIKYIESVNIDYFMANIYLENTIIDPSIVLTIKIDDRNIKYNENGEIATDERLIIKPYIVTPANLLHKDSNSIAYSYKGDFEINLITIEKEEGQLIYKQYNFNRSYRDRIVPTLIVKLPYIEKFWRHGDGVIRVEDNEVIRESYFNQAVPTLNDIIVNTISRDIIEAKHNYPTRWYITDDCYTCNGAGVVNEYDEAKSELCEVSCKACNGTGKKQRLNLFTDFQISQPDGKFDNAPQVPTPPMGYISPPIEPQRYITERINTDREIAFDWLGVNYSNSEVKGSETALARMIDREEMFATMLSYTNDIMKTYDWLLNLIARLAFPEREVVYKLNVYNQFKVVSRAENNAMFTELLNGGAPINIIEPIVATIYKESGKMDKFDIVKKYYLFINNKEAIDLYSKQIISKRALLLHINIMKWVEEIDLNGDIEAQLDELINEIEPNPLIL